MNFDVIRRTDPCDDYESIQLVGTGTYGECFKSLEIKTGNIVAVKIVKLETGDNFTTIQQEIHMLRSCTHPNIIAYYSSFLNRNKLYIVMEYCSGGSLQVRIEIKLTGPLKEPQIAFVCRETLRGLHYLHSMGKVHRDIKGANILLTEAGNVKLADFGVAAQITATIGKRKSFIGTPYWMSPDVACVEKKGGYGFECDVWAVGITAIELAELQPPHFEMHPMTVLYMMTKSNYKPPRLQDKEKWSPLFHEFVKLCLTKNPKRRPSPEKLLTTTNFVIGELSSHLTRELLDKVNNPGRPKSSMPEDDPSSRLSSFSDMSTINYSDAYPVAATASTPRQRLSFNSSVKINPIEGEHKATFFIDSGTMKAEEVENIQSPGNIKIIRRPTIHPPPPPNQVTTPPVPRPLHKSETEPTSHFRGVLSTPAVKMGACFINIFHGCEYRIHCTATWTNPQTKKKLLIIGAEEGLFTLDLEMLHEAALEPINKRKCVWLYVIKDVLIALQGRSPYLYRHDLVALTQNNITQKLSKTVNKIPERFLPKRLAVSVRMSDSKDCIQCCIEISPLGNKSIYCCCVVPNGLVLFQWYEPYQKFLLLKKIEVSKFPSLPLKPFQLLFGSNASDSDFPRVCLGVYRCTETSRFLLYMGDYNDYGETGSSSGSSQEEDGNATLTMKRLPKLSLSTPSFSCSTIEKIEVKSMKQLNSNTIIMAYNNKVVLIDMEGNLKVNNCITEQGTIVQIGQDDFYEGGNFYTCGQDTFNKELKRKAKHATNEYSGEIEECEKSDRYVKEGFVMSCVEDKFLGCVDWNGDLVKEGLFVIDNGLLRRCHLSSNGLKIRSEPKGCYNGTEDDDPTDEIFHVKKYAIWRYEDLDLRCGDDGIAVYKCHVDGNTIHTGNAWVDKDGTYHFCK
uniref:Non-specific serine/threonine protein kinase n=1 Tax=Rhabditophanes sp. KR3021 TaxID=114890 RepID=A0AC35U9J3_9BILA